MRVETVLITGASGLVGTSLSGFLASKGVEVRRLVRRDPVDTAEYRWDPYASEIDETAFKGLDAVVHLSGAGIGDKRWTPRRKREIYRSRIVSTRFLAEELSLLDDPPQVLVSQSATGIYGDRGDEWLTEESHLGPADDFLASLTRDWEEAAGPARAVGIRVAHPRTGIVIDRRSQLVARLLPIFKAGLGGKLGNGRQWWSWISLADTVDAIFHLLNESVDGPVNLVSPNPVRQVDFTRAFAAAVGRPALMTVPALGMRLGVGSEMAQAVGLSSARARPERLVELRYQFRYPDLDGALREAVS